LTLRLHFLGNSLASHGYIEKSDWLVMQFFAWAWVIASVIACSIWAKDIAKMKGHNATQWMVSGFIFGPIALLALTAYPDLEDRRHQRDTASELSLIKDNVGELCRNN
jgi:hypothetical protein